MKKVYLFQRERSKIGHAVKSRCNSLGGYGLDRMFGGGFRILCGQKAEGRGVLSPEPKAANYVTCKRCRKAMGLTGKTKEWKVEPVEQKDNRPRILGIPG